MKSFFRKTAGLVATLMLVSMLVPILAFASSFNVHYDSKGQLSGSVWLDGTIGKDVYDKYTTVNGTDRTIQIPVFKNNAQVDVLTATYASFSSETGYRFNLVPKVIPPSDGAPVVLKVVYGSGAGDTISSAELSPASIHGEAGATVLITDPASRADAHDVAEALRANANATVWVDGHEVALPASALTSGVTLTVANPYGSYTLPLGKLNVQAIAQDFGVPLTALSIWVKISPVSNEQQSVINSAFSSSGSTSTATAVNFSVLAEAAGQMPREVDFGGAYTQRTITIPRALSAIDKDKSTGVVFDVNTKSLVYVPSIFESMDSEYSRVVLWHTGNGIYTAATSNKAFIDVTGHWAENYIDKLANKLVVSGYLNKFEPQRSITRAEFISILVKAIGLPVIKLTTDYPFTDVKDGAWYTDTVNAAATAGLTSGYEDGSFKPNHTITREEMAVLLVKTLQHLGLSTDLTAAEANGFLAPYTDGNKVSSWARNYVAAAVEAGIISGTTAKTLDSGKNATRAETTVMITKTLQSIDFLE